MCLKHYKDLLYIADKSQTVPAKIPSCRLSWCHNLQFGMCLNQALPKVQIRCFQPPKKVCTECNHVDTAGFTQLQYNGEISHHLVCDT